MQVRISDIRIKDRIRQDLGDLRTLQRSMERVGLLHPILLDNQNNLIAGIRRLKVARSLNWETIAAIQINVRDKKERLLLEAEENTTRLDFTLEELERIKTLLKHYNRQSWRGRLLSWLLRLWRHYWGNTKSGSGRVTEQGHSSRKRASEISKSS